MSIQSETVTCRLSWVDLFLNCTTFEGGHFDKVGDKELLNFYRPNNILAKLDGDVDKWSISPEKEPDKKGHEGTNQNCRILYTYEQG